MRSKPCVCTVLYLGLAYSYASSGIGEPGTTFASALLHAKHEHHVSEACTQLLCSSDLGLQNEIPPDLGRAKGVCFNTLIMTFLFVTKLSGWHSGLSWLIYYMLFSLLHFHCLIHLNLCCCEILILRPSCLLMHLICPCSCSLKTFSSHDCLAGLGCIYCCS